MRRPRSILRSWAREDDGVAVVEFALILPFLLTLGLGAADTAMLVHQSHQVEQGLELGGAYLAKSHDPDSSLAAARNLARTGELSGGTSRVRGWNDAHITVTIRSEAGSYRNGARVVRLISEHDYDSPLGFLETVLGRTPKVEGMHEVRLGL